MNAYWKWEGAGIKFGYLKEEQKILSTFSPEQVSRVIHWKPVGRNQSRAHTIALVALDTGLRLSELLRLSRQDVDLNNLILRVHGKGNKQRLVPMSVALRKILYRHLAKHNDPLLFSTSVAWVMAAVGYPLPACNTATPPGSYHNP